MPKCKNSLIRYRVINRCLIDYDYPSFTRIKEACERALDITPLGRRTILKDIADMQLDPPEGYGAPIKYSKSYEGYYYSDQDFSIDKLNLNHEEIDTLMFTSSLMGHMRNAGLFETFDLALRKINDAINIQQARPRISDFDFIDFETVPVVRGGEWLPRLIKYIRNRQAVDIPLGFTQYLPGMVRPSLGHGSGGRIFFEFALGLQA